MQDKPLVEVKKLQKNYGDTQVLKEIDGTVMPGQVICVIGPSGSGKSTFLRCLNMLEKPTAGQVLFEGKDTSKFSDEELTVLRERMGMVFQSFNLFPNLTVLDNLKLAPIRVKKMSDKDAEEKAMGLLKRVGLEEKANVYPSSLSGGQAQRVAIARA